MKKNLFFFLLLIFSSCRKDPYPTCQNVKLDGWKMYTNCIYSEETPSGFYFMNENTGFITGYYGMVKRTDDRGVTWKDISIDNREISIEGISFINSDTGYISLRSMRDTSNNNLGVTYDGGKHWNTIAVNLNGWLSDIHFFNAQEAVAVFTIWQSGNNSVVTTNDGGYTWYNTGVHIIYGRIKWKIFFSNETLFAVDKEIEHLLKSTDKGNTWIQIPIPVLNLHEFNLIDSINYFVRGWTGDSLKTFRTINGGLTWNTMPDSFNYSFYHFFSNGLRGFATSHSQIPFEPDFNSNDIITYKYYSTSDGGSSWIQIGEGKQVYYSNSTWQFPSDNVGYSLNGGSIFRIERN